MKAFQPLKLYGCHSVCWRQFPSSLLPQTFHIIKLELQFGTGIQAQTSKSNATLVHFQVLVQRKISYPGWIILYFSTFSSFFLLLRRPCLNSNSTNTNLCEETIFHSGFESDFFCRSLFSCLKLISYCFLQGWELDLATFVHQACIPWLRLLYCMFLIFIHF